MLPKKRGNRRSSVPKLFRCTGFGNCNMVFTRSEHLARHERKHTGEKPFKCIVHGCERHFSRFDNMMQHTQTHSKRGDKKWDAPFDHQRPTTHPVLPPMVNPPQSTSFQSPVSAQVPYMNSNPMYPVHSPLSPIVDKDWAEQAPYYPQGLMSPVPSPLQTTSRRMSYSESTFDDSLYNGRRRSSSISSILATPASASPAYHPTVVTGQRRLSSFDLQLPIEKLQMTPVGDELPPLDQSQRLSLAQAPSIMSIHPTSMSEEETATVTNDEYEALQGFSKFRSKALYDQTTDIGVTHRRRSLPYLGDQSPNMASLVSAFRQNVLPVHESSERQIRQY